MAVSGKTTKLEWPYYLGTDKPPSMSVVTKAQAERAEAIFVGTAGQVPISKSTGVPAPTTIKGDATLAENGTLTLKRLTQTKRVEVTTETAASVEAVWPVAFADTEYTVQVTVARPGEKVSAVPAPFVHGLTKTGVIVEAVMHKGDVVHATAIHD
jgi:hypothetical protein